ncbi:hypothetical protein T4D_3911 [Trichinella pseudospiralis]|uniref:Uncharacterized protein n=1 Tax=Trichinella pseudospiralis TaxID=6337 RepID=A0A0V1DP32_TRIPS|nr:hypothetical protein T4D_3911 [Trichinella pseudospiralis]
MYKNIVLFRIARLSGKSDVFGDDFDNRLQTISSHKLI